MTKENTTKNEQTTNSKTDQKQAASRSSVWVKETDLVDRKPYLIAHGEQVYSVVYNANIQHFTGYGYHERVKPDYVLEYPEVPKGV